MADKWHVIYEQIKNYIALNPGIKISPSVVFIGSDKRTEFYKLFDALRTEFVKEYFPAELEKSYELSRNWKVASRTLIDDMHLEAINTHVGVKWFLSNPVEGLNRGLDNLLFDLLKNRLDIDVFKDRAIQVVSSDYQRYFREGYKLWAIISLIKLLEGDKIYTVMAVDERIDSTMLEADPGIGIYEDDIPEAKETNEIIFENVDVCSFLTPRIIIHSKLLNRFITLRPDFYQAHWKARLLSENQEWFDKKTINKDFGESNLWPDLAIYSANNLRDLRLIADYHKVARPDIIIDFEEKDTWPKTDVIASIKQHYDTLKPKLGAFMISRTPMPQLVMTELKLEPQLQNSIITDSTDDKYKSASEQLVVEIEPNIEEVSEISKTNELNINYMQEQERNINLISAGFDIDRLRSIIDILKDAIHPTNK